MSPYGCALLSFELALPTLRPTIRPFPFASLGLLTSSILWFLFLLAPAFLFFFRLHLRPSVNRHLG